MRVCRDREGLYICFSSRASKERREEGKESGEEREGVWIRDEGFRRRGFGGVILSGREKG